MPQLPTPNVVRERGKREGRRAVIFEDLDLVVKFGDPSWVRLEEAQTMIAIRQTLTSDEIVVPEVFGWKIDRGENFIYMSLIHGVTLRDGWPLLTDADKASICDELSHSVEALRRLKSDSSDPFIGTLRIFKACSEACVDTRLGSINRGVAQDNYFRAGNEAGPFESVKKFNDWVQSCILSQFPLPEDFFDPYRELLCDTCNVYFTHGDLHRSNIIISGTPGAQRIVGIIDWGQAGWYPEYWEYCKLLIPERWMEEWRSAGWVEKVMKPYPDEWEAISTYWLWLCP